MGKILVILSSSFGTIFEIIVSNHKMEVKMIRLKKTCFISCLVFICTQSIFSQPFQIEFKPAIGLFNPQSDILRKYYNQSVIFNYGGDLSVISQNYDLGIYLGMKRFSLKIIDESQSSYEESSTIYKIGIISCTNLRSFNLDTKLGLTKHDDNLLLSFNTNDSRLGFELGLEVDKNISNRMALFLEANYSYEHINIPEYVNVTYSRHQSYLSGKSLNTGGYFLIFGLSFLVN